MADKQTKAEQVRSLLRTRHGATIDKIVDATGWKPHSARAFLSGLRKANVPVRREQRADGTSFYRIAAG